MNFNRFKSHILLIITLLLNSVFAVFPQTYKIQGKTINQKTKDVIPYVNVGIKDQFIGTISNGKGIFEIRIPPEYQNDTLQVSHIGFKEYSFSIQDGMNEGYIEVLLEPTLYLLEEAIIVYNVNPKKIIKNAISMIEENYPSDTAFYEAYFREIVKSGSQYFNLTEAIIKLMRNPYTTENIYREPLTYRNELRIWASHKGSYYRVITIPEYTEDIRIFQANRIVDTIQSRIFGHFKIIGGPYYAAERDLVKNKISFLDKDKFVQYNYQFDGIVKHKNRNAYKLTFEQKNRLRKSLYMGEIYIDMKTFAIMHIRFGLSQLGIKYAKEKDFVYENPQNIIAKPIMSRYIVDYKYIDNKWRFNYSYGELKIQMIKEDINLKTILTFRDELVITKGEDISKSEFNKLYEFSPNEMLYRSVNKFKTAEWEKYNRIVPEKKLDDWINNIYKSKEYKSPSK